jgi:spore coat polysaccharide biosynthesis predicted glycosyltransferase SpsG
MIKTFIYDSSNPKDPMNATDEIISSFLATLERYELTHLADNGKIITIVHYQKKTATKVETKAERETRLTEGYSILKNK